MKLDSLTPSLNSNLAVSASISSSPQVDGNISLKTQDDEEEVAVGLNYALDGPDLKYTRSVANEISLGAEFTN